MSLLLDTSCWLWLQASPERISGTVRERLERDRLYLSAASAWEIAIKHGLGKLALPEPPETYVPDRMRRSAVEGLPVQIAHALEVTRLPLHHRDPFDRLLVAQSRLEKLPIVSADRQLADYDVEVLWAT